MNDNRTFLIGDHDLKTFLAEQSKNKKVKLGPNELFCLSCKVPRQPMGMIADEVTQSAITIYEKP